MQCNTQFTLLFASKTIFCKNLYSEEFDKEKLKFNEKKLREFEIG